MYYLCKLCRISRNLDEICALSCKHIFCLICLEQYILDNMSRSIKCPLSRCDGKVEDKQIKQILSTEDIEKYEAKYLEDLPGAHQCILPLCGTINQCPPGSLNFICKNCFLWNCITCKAPHCEITCIMYKSLTTKQIDDKYKIHIEKARNEVFKKSRKSFFDAVKQDLLINDKVFECVLCLRCIGKEKGIKLRTCFHLICRLCIIKYILNENNFPVMCPYGNCTISIEDREVKHLLTKEEYNIYERKGLNRVKSKISNSYQCQEVNCDYFCVFKNDTITKFRCPKCKTTNCLKCKAVHPGRNCSEYQRAILNDHEIEDSIKEGKCMRCPDCNTLVSKSRGCNWIKCPRCDLELCWILRMRRWGPKGKGDTSGGCLCSANKFCHPNCTGCIPDR